jgi:hypothetical protein
VVDALLDNKQAAISEAKRAVEMLPVSKDAMDGPGIALNLAVVYAWTNEVDMAFETLDRLTKTPNSFRYGLMKADRFWDPPIALLGADKVKWNSNQPEPYSPRRQNHHCPRLPSFR